MNRYYLYLIDHDNVDQTLKHEKVYDKTLDQTAQTASEEERIIISISSNE